MNEDRDRTRLILMTMSGAGFMPLGIGCRHHCGSVVSFKPTRDAEDIPGGELRCVALRTRCQA